VESVTTRPLTPADAPIANALLAEAFGETLHAESPRAALARALAGDAPAEARGIVAVLADAVVGVAVHGAVAGTIGAARLHAVAVASAVRRRGIGGALIAAAVAEQRRRGARLVVVECADADAFGAGRALLLRCGFLEESRIADYVRDGIGLSFLRLDLAAHE